MQRNVIIMLKTLNSLLSYCEVILSVVIGLIEINEDVRTTSGFARVCNTLHAQIELTEN